MFGRFFNKRSIIYLIGIGLVVVFAGLYYYDPDYCPEAENGKVALTVNGLSWDSDSSGFAFIQGLSKEEGSKKAGRIGSKVFVDGQPERFVVTEAGAEFKIKFETDQPTFRLIAEGERFPPTISQPYQVPKSGCRIDIGKLNAPRGEGPEHTWPLPIVAEKMAYGSWQEMMADNNAVVRILTRGSGEEGTPGLANNSLVKPVDSQILVYPFDMDKKITFLQMDDVRIGAFIAVISFSPDQPVDREIVLNIVDTVTEADWNPPRPWKFDPVTVFVRNGFATDIRVAPSADQ